MRLSIIVPSNRDSVGAYARIMQACSWASGDVEVIVRDNSGSARKREVLGAIDQPDCRIIFAEPCDANTNFLRALAASSGEFVLFLGDDDAGFDRGISAISAAAALFADDVSVAGLTGAYVLEQTDTSHIISYPKIDSFESAERVGGYLGYQGPNLIFYSAVRRSVLSETWTFIFDHPLNFSFHDHFFSLIYLLCGRFIHVGRVVFVYDNANWEGAGVGVQSDLRHYAKAGMDPAIRQLHWMICGFEGAAIILQSRFGLRHSLAQRQAMANQWFEVMFRRFAGDAGARFDSRLAAEANGLHEKWRREAPNFTLESLLADICGFIGLTSPEKAEAYRSFWTAVAATPAL
ncbi:MAG TPA: hypothetical protein VHZ26_13365 [Caulobacteraceae bacterium]|jgi:hypothetical protein|nr:hypothetical protein [Caulobacteraceae bacterium]